MQRFHHLLTSLVFVAHALLGCGVHHFCRHGLAVEEAAHHCSHHDGPANRHGDSDAPADSHRCPAQPCHHVACSFVKGDSVRIGQGERDISPAIPPLYTAHVDAAQSRVAACEPICEAALSSTHLYVWHCALLI